MLDLLPDAPRTLVLGRVRYVEGVRRRWTSGTHSEKLTMIVSFAGHEIDAFEGWYVDEVPVTLDGSGWVQEAPWKQTVNEPASDTGTADGSGGVVIALSHTPVASSWTATWSIGNSDQYQAGSASVSVVGTTATVTGAYPGSTVTVNYTRSVGTTYLRIRPYLGTAAQNIGDAIDAEYPGKITAGDKFAGIASAVVDMIYSPDVFPQGPPNLTGVKRGAKCYDPRKDDSVVGASTSTWNSSDKDADVALSSGARLASVTAPAQGGVRGTAARPASGDWYFEVTLEGVDVRQMIGIGQAGSSLVYPGADANGRGYWPDSGEKYVGGTGSAFAGSLVVGYVVGVRLHGGTLSYYANGIPIGDAFTGLTGDWYPMWGTDTSVTGLRSGRINTGQEPFHSGLPSGASAWGGAGAHDIADPATWEWTENSALCALRYAMWSSGLGLAYGRGITAQTLADVIAAANKCDISTDFNLLMPDTSTDTVTLPRHRCGITISADADPRQAMDAIVDTMAGEWAFDGPELRLRAGVKAASVASIDQTWLVESYNPGDEDAEDPVLTSAQSISREQRWNHVGGSCVDPSERYQMLPYPAVRDSTLITAKGEKRGELDLPGVNHVAHAQHLASMEIRRRQAGTLQVLQCDPRAELLQLFDVVTETIPDYGISAKTFEVVGVEISFSDAPARLMLREISDALFTVDAELTGRDPAPDSSLRAPWDVGTLGTLTVTSGTAALQDNSIVARALVTWPAVTGEWIRSGGKIEIQYTRADQALPSGDWASWVEEGNSSGATIPGLLTGRPYLFRGRLVQPMPLVRGPWSAVTQHTMSWAIAASSAIGGGNLLRNSSFEVDSDSNGVADNWTAFSGGTTGTITHSGSTTITAFGGRGQRVDTTNLGTTSSDRVGYAQLGVSVAGAAGRQAVLSGYGFVAPTATKMTLNVVWLDSSNAVIGSGVSTVFDATNTLTRYATPPMQIPTNAAKADVAVWFHSRPSSAGAFTGIFDCVKFEVGNVATAYSPRADELLTGVVQTSNLAPNSVTITDFLSGGSGSWVSNPTGDAVTIGTAATGGSGLGAASAFTNATGSAVLVQVDVALYDLGDMGTGGGPSAFIQYQINGGSFQTKAIYGSAGGATPGLGLGMVAIPLAATESLTLVRLMGVTTATKSAGFSGWTFRLSAMLR